MENDLTIEAGKNLSKSISNDVYVSVKNWYRKLDPGQTKLKQYREGVEHVLNKIQIMGMTEEKKITHLYVSLKFYPELRKSIQDSLDADSIFKMVDVAREADVFNVEESILNMGYGHIIKKKLNTNTTRKRRIAEFEDYLEIKDDVVEVERKKQKKREKQNALKERYKEKEIERQKIKEKEKESILEREAINNSKVIHGLDALSFVNNQDKLLVLGQPGGGKTTFLKYLSLVYTGHLPTLKEVSPLIPIFIPLRNFSKAIDVERTSNWFLSFVLICVSEITENADTSKWIGHQLVKGNCILLVDGLDEVPSENLTDILEAFRAFSNQYRKNKYVVTCRTAAYQYSLEGFRICEVDDFNYEDIISFSLQWFGTKVHKQKQFIKDLNNSDIARELCKTPLLTTMMCLMYDYNQRIPENRYELYNSCSETLMYRWDTFRSIDRSKRIDISNTRKRYILSNLAKKTFDSESLYIKKDDLLGMLSDELSILDISVDPNDFLYDFEANMGILIEKSHHIYCFSHLTFHEFFTAVCYLERNEVEALFELAFEKHRYREVFLLAVEKLYIADKLGLMLAGRVKHLYLEKELGNGYLYNLIADLLLSQAVFSKEVRIVLNSVCNELVFYSENQC